MGRLPHSLDGPDPAGGPVTGGDTWLVTRRLRLRRPGAEDLTHYVRLHTDPRTYVHKPAAMATEQECVDQFLAVVDRWNGDGVGYGPVVERDTGEVVGWAGLRVAGHSGEPHLNLYYRLQPEVHGRGLGRELARGLACWAAECRPDLPVRAVVAPVNQASCATALAAGLVEVWRADHPSFPEDEPDVVLELPRVRVVAAPDVAPDEVVDLWCRVNDAGGAVGFLPGAARERVEAALQQHVDLIRRGLATLVCLRSPDGRLLGFGFWEHTGHPGFDHVATLKRLMVDPDGRGRNWGALLLAGMVGVARRELPGIGLLLLDYRSGLGLGDFYARAGWTEVGRVPGAIRVGEDEFRDDVLMARRVDGRPLLPDGRT
ncbi:hypothetical protein IDVR_24030 [Intrasporangium sp. DVR]